MAVGYLCMVYDSIDRWDMKECFFRQTFNCIQYDSTILFMCLFCVASHNAHTMMWWVVVMLCCEIQLFYNTTEHERDTKNRILHNQTPHNGDIHISLFWHTSQRRCCCCHSTQRTAHTQHILSRNCTETHVSEHMGVVWCTMIEAINACARRLVMNVAEWSSRTTLSHWL